ncbi:hypothetical protein PENNAL_c0655G07664 [Penicillium nalgiovense]|uniref:Uncharacterized protein n=1 Tax=Penicillium nalgiovense TaxID=60175 RepID=A0A1V6V4A1_PENNA|nr:hypothetical protein PENNAL_c0655G07664 [Penicillium nalgiovense]
MYYRRECVRLL